ncbi:MAG: NAD(P)H-dependent oxidoreductase [Patescibacteria group bacterium]|nr:NAD(P)H-dependent oxidoreductase [Patescibacteria group bacterium]
MPRLKFTDAELKRKLGVDQKTLDRFKAVRQAAIEEAKKLDRKGTAMKVLGISGSAREEMGMAQEESNSERLLKVCLKDCQNLGAETELVQLRKYNIQHCKCCYSSVNTQCHFYCSCYPKGTPQGDDMSNLMYDKILGADAIIFATPVNNFKMSTLMAAFIDRCISLDGSLQPADPKSPKDKALNVKHMKFIELTADDGMPGSGFVRRFSNKVAGIITTGHEEGASMVISSLFMTLNNFGMIFPPFSHMYAMSSVCYPTYADKPIVTGECYEDEVGLLAQNVMTGVRLARSVKSSDWKNDYQAN